MSGERAVPDGAAIDGVEIRAYRGGDERGIVHAWNRALPQDPIDLDRFLKTIVCDVNFDPRGLSVAVADGQVIGFSLAICRKLPLSGGDLEPERGWITAFGVVPQWRGKGVGSALLEAGERFVRELGRKEVLVSPYAPNYIWPGVDPEAYGAALRLLEGRGYQTLYTAVAMDKRIVGFEVPPEVEELQARREREGYSIGPLTPEYVHETLAFASDAFNPDWGRAIREAIKAGIPFQQCLIATNRERRVVGFALFGGYDGILERFGPFGVDPSERGKGLGTILLYRSLEAMRARGAHSAWFLWTGERTAAGQLYLKAGFEITRTFWVMRRQL